jgi:ATP dependent DNA ligase-like protein
LEPEKLPTTMGIAAAKPITDRDRKTGAMRALIARAQEQGLVYAGAALISLSAKAREELKVRLKGLSAQVPPIAGLRLKDAHWSEPELVVRVRHLAGATTLRHATVRAVEWLAKSQT